MKGVLELSVKEIQDAVRDYCLSPNYRRTLKSEEDIAGIEFSRVNEDAKGVSTFVFMVEEKNQGGGRW